MENSQTLPQRKESNSIASLAIRSLKRCRRQIRVADSLGTELTGKQLLTRALALRHHLRTHYFTTNETNIGVLLPPSVTAVVCNLALTLDRRVVVNLNYTLGESDIRKCIDQAGIEHVLTSRRFLERVKLSVESHHILLEDLVGSISKLDLLKAFIGAYVTPAHILERKLQLANSFGDELATVIFTSGSTGDPKGVMLTHRNVVHNLAEIARVGSLRSDDVLLGVLPFFHSFGFTAGLWAALTQNTSAVFHFNPLEMERIGSLAEKYKATILHSTPSLLRRYLRRIEPRQFSDVDFVLVGAEPMPLALADDFETRFGSRPVEAYGTTETSPLISINVPASRSPFSDGSDRRDGSVGRPATHVEVKIVGVEKGGELETGTEGLILVRGPNVMKGYLGRDDLTCKVIRDGWYHTGDIGYLDSDGFLFITGRQSRFSKIGGEMIPHIKIEQALAEFLRAGCDDDRVCVAVTAAQNAAGEEQLAVLYCESGATPDEMREHLRKVGLPNLYLPQERAFTSVESIPCLGTGKLDLRAVKHLAQSSFDNLR